MKVKLIIWDLDDTLWLGMIAEENVPNVSKYRINMMQKSNQRGIVNTICSKNDKINQAI